MPQSPEASLIEDLTNQMKRSPRKRLEQMVRYSDEQSAAILKQWIHQGARILMPRSRRSPPRRVHGCPGRRAAAPGRGRLRASQTAAERPVDREAEHVAEAFLRGSNEGLDTARAELAAKLEAAEASVRGTARGGARRWAAEQGAALAERDRSGARAARHRRSATRSPRSSHHSSRRRCAQRIVEELLRTLEKVLKGGRPATLKISGPDDLLDSIRQALGEKRRRDRV